MKILITSFTFYPERNGVANVVLEHALGLLKFGHEVEIVTSKNNNRDVTEISKLGLRFKDFYIGGNHKLNSRYYGDIQGYKNYIQESNADVIISHCWQMWNTDLIIDILPKKNTKSILFSHGVSFNEIYNFKTFVSYFLWRPYVWFLFPRILKSFDLIAIMSEKEDYNRFYDFKLIKKYNLNYNIIPNGFHIDKLNDLKKVTKSNKYMILSVGNYSVNKNEKDVLEAFKLSNIENCDLIFIGKEKNAYYNKLVNYYNENLHIFKKDNKSVEFLINIPYMDILNYFYTADLFVTASKTEYFPLVILESMATKTPFISYDIGCVSDFKGGKIVFSIREMSNEIYNLLVNKDCNLGKLGYLQIKENFDWNNILNKLNNLVSS